MLKIAIHAYVYCIIHNNLDLKLCALYEAKIIPYYSYQKLLEHLCRDRHNEDCLSRTCSTCINKNPNYKDFDNSKVIKYKMWIAERQETQDRKTKKPRIVTKYLKKIFDIHPRQLIKQLQEVKLSSVWLYMYLILQRKSLRLYLQISFEITCTCISSCWKEILFFNNFINIYIYKTQRWLTDIVIYQRTAQTTGRIGLKLGMQVDVMT